MTVDARLRSTRSNASAAAIVRHASKSTPNRAGTRSELPPGSCISHAYGETSRNGWPHAFASGPSASASMTIDAMT